MNNGWENKYLLGQAPQSSRTVEWAFATVLSAQHRWHPKRSTFCIAGDLGPGAIRRSRLELYLLSDQAGLLCVLQVVPVPLGHSPVDSLLDPSDILDETNGLAGVANAHTCSPSAPSAQRLCDICCWSPKWKQSHWFVNLGSGDPRCKCQEVADSRSQPTSMLNT